MHRLPPAPRRRGRRDSRGHRAAPGWRAHARPGQGRAAPIDRRSHRRQSGHGDAALRPASNSRCRRDRAPGRIPAGASVNARLHRGTFARLLSAWVCVLGGAQALAAPEPVKKEIAARLERQYPDLKGADYALGSAAFDTELRAALEEHANAAAESIDAGRALWNAKFRDAKSLASCFPNGGRRIAPNYPQYDAGLQRGGTIALAVKQCLKGHKQPLYHPADPPPICAIVSDVSSLALGQRIP